MYAYGFRYYFTLLVGVLFTFPSRYWFTIGYERVFSLRRWFSRIPTDFHLFRGTWVQSHKVLMLHLQGYHLLWPGFPSGSIHIMIFYFMKLLQTLLGLSRNTAGTTVVSFNMPVSLDFFLFARHYLGNHYCFLFHRVLRCFTSPG